MAKLTMSLTSQLVEQNPNLFDLLAKKLGCSQTKVKRRIEKGEVDENVIHEVLTEQNSQN